MAKASSKKSEKNIEELTYEEALLELEEIVETLESETSPLEDSMKRFERGQLLIARCNALLDAARLNVEKLAGESVTPFEEEIE